MRKLLIAISIPLLIAGCKSKDEAPAPSNTNNNNNGNYNWTASIAIPSGDTLAAKNGSLYYSAQGLNNPSATQQYSQTWSKSALSGDFEINIQFDSLNSDISSLNIPFVFMLSSNTNANKQTSINLGEAITEIQYGSGTSFNYDLKQSTSGSIVIKRIGSDFHIALTKDYLNGGVPAQYVQQKDSTGWFSDDASFSFVVLNSSSQRARIHWKDFVLKTTTDTIHDPFDEMLVKLK